MGNELKASGVVDLVTEDVPGNASDDGSASRSLKQGRILTIPNILTLFRIALVLPFVHLIAEGRYLTAMGVFFAAGATDFADGFAARRLGQQSYIGRLLDPLADKVLIAAAYIVMAVPHKALPSIPLWLAVTVIGRDLLIVVGSLIVYSVVRFKDFKPTFMSKLNTTVELAFIFYFLLAHGWQPASFMKAFSLICYLIVVFTVAVSSAEYANQGIRIVREHRGKTRSDIVL